MLKLLLPLPLLLGACAPLAELISPPYEPKAIRIYNQSAYEASVAECRAAGVAFKPGFSIGGAIRKTVDGATSNTSLVPVSPLVPVYGAAGGALGAASDGLDIMSREHNNVFRNCLRDETRHDGSAIVADPRD